MVPVFDIQQKFFFAGNKVCPVIGPNNGGNSMTVAEPFNSHHTATGVHAWDHFEVDGSSCKASEERAPTFFSRTRDRYKKGSEVVNASI